MSANLRHGFIVAIILLIVGLFFVRKVNAATLVNTSDLVTTSRPSASTPLAANQAAAAGQVTIYDNDSYFIASDTATLWPTTGETLNTVNVASMSATGVPSAGQRIIYFTGTAANTHHNGDAISAAVTATHTIKFTTVSTVPGSGHIILTFPGAGSNTASPSATGFSFNNMTTSNPTDVKFNNATCSSVSVTNSNTINCTLNASGISANTTVTVLVGCTAQSSGVCTTYAPRLINPTASSAQCSGSTCTADTWNIQVQTTDNNSIVLDSSTALVGTVQAVQVQATVQPSITFSIIGEPDGTNINTLSGSCGSITTNAGISPTATFVNLGSVTNAQVNMEAQELQVATNGSAGYAITATSSGRFINPSSGFWITDANGGNGLTANDTPVPATITAGTADFGIHACGARSGALVGSSGIAAGDIWVNAGTQNGTTGTAKFSNPWNSGTNGYYATIASYTGGPVNTENTVVLYGVTASPTTPAGTYSNYFTYVATATF